MHDLTTPAGVVAHMSEAATEEDWREHCAAVKAANFGGYPCFWYETMEASGLFYKTLGVGNSGI